MGACTKISKFLLFLFNILFWAGGGAMLGLGIYFRVRDDANAIVEIAGVTFYYAGCYLMISIGSIMFVLGFLGCCGAIKENKCLLGLYVFFLVVILIMQLFVGIWGFVNRDTNGLADLAACLLCGTVISRNLIMEFDTPHNRQQVCLVSWMTSYHTIEQDIQNALNDLVPMTYDANNATIQSVLTLQNSFKCCGLVKGCTDWSGSAAYGCTCSGGSNCVPPARISCTNSDENGSNIYSEDCYDAIHDAVINNIGLVAGIAVGIAVLEIFGIIFAIVICRDRQKEYKSY